MRHQHRRDAHLQTLVYKLVTDLCKSECQRRQVFDGKHHSPTASLRSRRASPSDDAAGWADNRRHSSSQRNRRRRVKTVADGDSNNNTNDDNDHQSADDECTNDDGADDMTGNANEFFAADDPIRCVCFVNLPQLFSTAMFRVKVIGVASYFNLTRPPSRKSTQTLASASNTIRWPWPDIQPAMCRL